MEREFNVGFFGRGGGDFDAGGNMRKNSPMYFEQFGRTQGANQGKKTNHLLGDFTIYRVNKEFENFWDVTRRLRSSKQEI